MAEYPKRICALLSGKSYSMKTALTLITCKSFKQIDNTKPLEVLFQTDS